LPSSGRKIDRRTPRAKRGAMLLECVLALAIMVVAGLAILAMADGAARSAEVTRDAELAADLARSAMGRIESGIATPETLSGPIRDWQDQGDGVFAEAVIEDGPEWVVEIDTEESNFTGLTLVHVRAVKLASAGSDRELTSFSLHQLVRLSQDGEGGGP
jgi:hypothetical protein